MIDKSKGFKMKKEIIALLNIFTEKLGFVASMEIWQILSFAHIYSYSAHGLRKFVTYNS